MTTVVTLSRWWLHSISDPDDYIALRVNDFKPSKSTPGRFEDNAGGYFRLITNGAGKRSLVASVVRPNDAERQWLDDHEGDTLVSLDPDGGKFAGAYLDWGYAHPIEGVEDVEIVLTEVTYSEAV